MARHQFALDVTISVMCDRCLREQESSHSDEKRSIAEFEADGWVYHPERPRGCRQYCPDCAMIVAP